MTKDTQTQNDGELIAETVKREGGEDEWMMAMRAAIVAIGAAMTRKKNMPQKIKFPGGQVEFSGDRQSAKATVRRNI